MRRMASVERCGFTTSPRTGQQRMDPLIHRATHTTCGGTHDPWWPMDINHRDVVPLLCWFRISKLVRHAINPTVQYIKYIITSIILVICTPTWLLWIRWINHPKQAILGLCACEIPTAQGPAVFQPFLMLKNPQLLPGSRSSQPQVLTLTAMPCFFIYRFWVIPKKNIVRDWYCSIFLILI